MAGTATLTTANTAIVVDSTADFPEAPQRYPNWRVVPLYLRFGAESFRDYVELSPGDFYERLRTAEELPTTSQPTPADFLATYEQLSVYDRIYSLHLSGDLSGTYASATTAGEELGGDKVRTVDTGTASAAVAMLGLAIQRRLDRGTTDEEIQGLLERYERDAHLLFTVDTLEFLGRGGRIGRASALLGSVLQVKPVLCIRDGLVTPLERVRTFDRALNRVVELTREMDHGQGLCVIVGHADAEGDAERLEQELEPVAETLMIHPLGPVVGAHAGPGVVGVGCYSADILPLGLKRSPTAQTRA